MIEVGEGIFIDERELDERFVRASGPGGQNVNKVATAVELRFDISASALPEAVKERLRTVAGKRVNASGVLLIDSREFRTQAQNRTAARERLLALIARASRPPRRRRPTRPSAASRERRLESKKARGAIKEQRNRKNGD